MHKGIKIYKNLVFGTTDKENLTADVYFPKDSKDCPAVLLVHGGAFRSGSKEMYADWGRYLAENGFIAVAINYRLATSDYSTWPDVNNDLIVAVNWMVSKSNEWSMDPLRMAVVGDSAGAYLASMLAFNSETSSYNILTVVGIYGVYDLVNYYSEREKKMFKQFMGASYEKHANIASPINHIKKAAESPIFQTSFYIIWGEEDPVANPEHSKSFIEELKLAKIENKTLSIPNKGHFWFNILPEIDGGGINDYPNSHVAPKILSYLKQKLKITNVGNYSKNQIDQIRKLNKV